MTVAYTLSTEIAGAYASGQLVVGWVSRSVVDVQGPDAVTYLQGQLSADVAGLRDGESCRTLLLYPTGKLCAWLSVCRVSAERLLLVGHEGVAHSVIERLNRFRLRSRVEITPRQWLVIAVRTKASLDAPTIAAIVPDLAESVVAVADARWNGDESVDALVDGNVSDLTRQALVVDATVIDALDTWRTVPAWGVELVDDALPAESGIVASSVSFTKGCYTGQELTARMDSRNTVPPKVLTVVRGLESITDEQWSPTSSVTCGDTTVQLGFVARSNLTDQQRVGSEPVPPLRLSLRS